MRRDEEIDHRKEEGGDKDRRMKREVRKKNEKNRHGEC